MPGATWHFGDECMAGMQQLGADLVLLRVDRGTVVVVGYHAWASDLAAKCTPGAPSACSWSRMAASTRAAWLA